MWHLRPENPNKEKPRLLDGEKESFYVDAFKMGRVLQHLLETLELTDGYSLFIMNPKKAVDDNGVYGYRVGFSEQELAVLREKESEWAMYLASSKGQGQSTEGLSALLRNGPDMSEVEKEIEAQHVTDQEDEKRLRWTNLMHKSEIWAKWYIQSRVAGGGEQAPRACSNSGEDAAEDAACIWRSQRAEIMDIVALAKDMAENGTAAQRQYLERVRQGLVQEDCLVDTWLGHSRFGFIDISAGPFRWGLVVAGQGVRSLSTLPSVPPYYALHPESDPTREEAEAGKDHKEKNSVQQLEETLGALRKNQRANDLELMKASYSSTCLSGRQLTREQQILCEYLEKSLAEAEQASGTDDRFLTGGEDEGSDVSVLLDNFLSSLAATISRSLHHIATPPAPLFPSYYTQRVTFHFFVISTHSEYKPMDFFDYEAYKREMLKLKLPTQEFSFVLKRIEIGDDKEVRMALHDSLRTMMMPLLDPQGKFYTSSIRYIDSGALKQQLKALGVDEEEDKRKHLLEEEEERDQRSGKGVFSRHIPIFLFSLNEDLPVFIDRYYQAKAMDDMILIVQSNQRRYESKVQCNGKPVYWDLKAPLKAAIAATALHYGGLIPMHITYDDANKCAAQDWLWSVGDNPLAHTSHHHHFTRLQKDILYRNFIINALEDSIEKVNLGTELLLAVPTTRDNFEERTTLPLTRITVTYRNVRRDWEIIAEFVKELEFGPAIKLLPELERRSKQYLSLAKETVATLAALQCKEGSNALLSGLAPSTEGVESIWQSGWILPSALLFDGLVIILYFALRKTTTKVKTN
ncbi:Transmembrane protein [Balamuthia mandrillaris]